ncbi:hypothetical protein ACH5RR_040791, partial [Cinchona calisaya]
FKIKVGSLLYYTRIPTLQKYQKAILPPELSATTTGICPKKMSKRGKKKDEDYAYEEEETKRPKKFSKSDDSDDADADDIVVCEISKNRRVSVRNWQGKIVVDIREFYVKDGKQMPGKKGISLTMDQWTVLRDHVEEIDKVGME